MSDDYKVTIRIGAQLDSRSFDATLGDAQKRAQKAAQATARATATADRQGSREKVESARSAEREIAAIQRAQLAQQRSAMRQFYAEWKRDQKDAARVEREERRAAHRDAMILVNAELRAKRQAARESARAEREAQNERERFAFRTSHRATRFLFPPPAGLLGHGHRVARDVMRGVGMDWSLAAGLERNRENEALASQISNQGWVPGEGDFDKRITKEQIRANSQTVAAKYAFSENEISEGTQTYINLTGDLKGALPLMDKLALLSRATGTSLSDAAQAAADMSVQFEGLPDKGKRVADMLGIAAMEGKTGALELFQIAKQMPRIVSQAGFFAGDRSVSMANLLAATQITRRYGGAGSPAQAATVIQGVVAAIEKGDKNFKKAGVKTRDDKGALLALPEIIANSINASYTKGGKFDSDKFFDMWNAIRGGKLAMGAKTLYDRAGGGDAGIKAVKDEFKKFTKGMNEDALKLLSESAVDNQSRKSQLFQQQMDKVAQNLQQQLLPTLIELEPKILELTQAFAGLITFTANHLPSAIMLAITASIARAGIESAFRMGIDRMLGASSPAMATWTAGFKTFNGGLMTTAQLLGTFAISFGSTMAALNALNEWIESKTGKAGNKLNALDKNVQASLEQVDNRTDLTDAEKASEKAKVMRLALRHVEYEKEEAGLGTFGMTRIGGILTMNAHTQAVQNSYAEQEGRYQGLAERYEQESALRNNYAGDAKMRNVEGKAGIAPGVSNEGIAQALIQALAGITLKTNVTNAADIRAVNATGPHVDANGRTPPPGHRPP